MTTFRAEIDKKLERQPRIGLVCSTHLTPGFAVAMTIEGSGVSTSLILSVSRTRELGEALLEMANAYEKEFA